MQIIIGIDDTDNLESRGTGHCARQLGLSLVASNLIELQSITRHQLLVDSRIPYTSHNSSASLTCIAIGKTESIIEHCREFLLRESANGSDVGLCIAKLTDVSNNVISWGNRAKIEILTKFEAHQLAKENNIHLEGLTGEKIGVIGSLAAVGLRVEGNDGRLLWLQNLRNTIGIFPALELQNLLPVDVICDLLGTSINNQEKINTGEWCRPVMINKKITLIVEKETNNGNYQWKSASKEYIKSISQ